MQEITHQMQASLPNYAKLARTLPSIEQSVDASLRQIEQFSQHLILRKQKVVKLDLSALYFLQEKVEQLENQAKQLNIHELSIYYQALTQLLQLIKQHIYAPQLIDILLDIQKAIQASFEYLQETHFISEQKPWRLAFFYQQIEQHTQRLSESISDTSFVTDAAFKKTSYIEHHEILESWQNLFTAYRIKEEGLSQQLQEHNLQYLQNAQKSKKNKYFSSEKDVSKIQYYAFLPKKQALLLKQGFQEFKAIISQKLQKTNLTYQSLYQASTHQLNNFYHLLRQLKQPMLLNLCQFCEYLQNYANQIKEAQESQESQESQKGQKGQKNQKSNEKNNLNASKQEISLDIASILLLIDYMLPYIWRLHALEMNDLDAFSYLLYDFLNAKYPINEYAQTNISELKNHEQPQEQTEKQQFEQEDFSQNLELQNIKAKKIHLNHHDLQNLYEYVYQQNLMQQLRHVLLNLLKKIESFHQNATENLQKAQEILLQNNSKSSSKNNLDDDAENQNPSFRLPHAYHLKLNVSEQNTFNLPAKKNLQLLKDVLLFLGFEDCKSHYILLENVLNQPYQRQNTYIYQGVKQYLETARCEQYHAANTGEIAQNLAFAADINTLNFSTPLAHAHSSTQLESANINVAANTQNSENLANLANFANPTNEVAIDAIDIDVTQSFFTEIEEPLSILSQQLASPLRLQITKITVALQNIRRSAKLFALDTWQNYMIFLLDCLKDLSFIHLNSQNQTANHIKQTAPQLSSLIDVQAQNLQFFLNDLNELISYAAQKNTTPVFGQHMIAQPCDTTLPKTIKNTQKDLSQTSSMIEPYDENVLKNHMPIQNALDKQKKLQSIFLQEAKSLLQKIKKIIDLHLSQGYENQINLPLEVYLDKLAQKLYPLMHTLVGAASTSGCKNLQNLFTDFEQYLKKQSHGKNELSRQNFQTILVMYPQMHELALDILKDWPETVTADIQMQMELLLKAVSFLYADSEDEKNTKNNQNTENAENAENTKNNLNQQNQSLDLNKSKSTFDFSQNLMTDDAIFQLNPNLASSLDSELTEAFVDEAFDLQQKIQQEITHIYQQTKLQTENESILNIQRYLHTLKGGARTIGFSELGEIYHQLETEFLDHLHASETLDFFTAYLKHFSHLIDVLTQWLHQIGSFSVGNAQQILNQTHAAAPIDLVLDEAIPKSPAKYHANAKNASILKPLSFSLSNLAAFNLNQEHLQTLEPSRARPSKSEYNNSTWSPLAMQPSAEIINSKEKAPLSHQALNDKFNSNFGSDFGGDFGGDFGADVDDSTFGFIQNQSQTQLLSTSTSKSVFIQNLNHHDFQHSLIKYLDQATQQHHFFNLDQEVETNPLQKFEIFTQPSQNLKEKETQASSTSLKNNDQLNDLNDLEGVKKLQNQQLEVGHKPSSAEANHKKGDDAQEINIKISIQKLEQMIAEVANLQYQFQEFSYQIKRLEGNFDEILRMNDQANILLKGLDQKMQPPKSIINSMSTFGSISINQSQPQSAQSYFPPFKKNEKSQSAHSRTPAPTYNLYNLDALEFDDYSEHQHDLNQLNSLMNANQEQIKKHHQTLGQFAIQANDLHERLIQVQEVWHDLSLLDLKIIEPRLQAISQVCAKEQKKDIRLLLKIQPIKVPKSILDQISFMCEHLIRNAIIHGIEPADQRLHKPKTGLIMIEIRQKGEQLYFKIADDGGGIHVEKIKEKAIANGRLSIGQEVSREQLIEWMLEPGFSTANLTLSAGRGIGLDSVLANIKQNGGEFIITCPPSSGLIIEAFLPLLSFMSDILVAQAGDYIFGIPTGYIEEVLLFDAHQKYIMMSDVMQTYNHHCQHLVSIKTAQGLEYIALNIVEYCKMFIRNSPLIFHPKGLIGMSLGKQSKLLAIYNPIMLLQHHQKQHLQLFQSKSADDSAHFKNIRAHYLSQQTLQYQYNPHQQNYQLNQAWRDQAPPISSSLTPFNITEAINPAMIDHPLLHTPTVLRQQPQIMAVDDSATIRLNIEKHLNKNYQVHLAIDGLDALEQLAQLKHKNIIIDLFLLDIEMPRMDGFELLQALRQDAFYQDTPVIMLSSRQGEKYQTRAYEWGANDYLTKPYQVQELLIRIIREVTKSQRLKKHRGV